MQYQHDGLGNLVSAAYSDGKVDLRMPDAIGNLFKAEHRKDRKYSPAGQLLESHGPEGVTRYEYDPEGNLARKILSDGREWKYEWNAAGMLSKVLRPDGKVVEFGYDALGRRVWKKYGAKTTKWVWDGNVPVHEWVEVDPKALPASQADPSAESQISAVEAAIRQRQAVLSAQPAQGPPPSAITWIFEPESFAPIAKLSDNERNSIITDHLGTPTTMLDGAGREVWSADIGVYGDLRNVVGDKQACPFRWPGQYEDEETGLYYNRFRYYDPDAGEYVSQDPIGLTGGNPTLYGYTKDPLVRIDPLGLALCKVASVNKKLGHVTGSFDALRPGPLSGELAATFSGGRYHEVILKRDTVLYRGGVAGKPLGQFFNIHPPKSEIQARIDKAVLPRWPGGGTSPIDSAIGVRVPKGTKVYVGEVGSQGGMFVGGTQQVVVPTPWSIPGVTVDSIVPIK